MKPARRQNPIVYALLLNAALLLVILIVLVTRNTPTGLNGMAFAEPPQMAPIAGGAGIFLMPAQFHQNVWGCYLLDVDRQTLCAYEYQSGSKTLELSAARNFRADLQLKNMNTRPEPDEVQRLVKDQADSGRVVGSNHNAAPVEKPDSGQ